MKLKLNYFLFLTSFSSLFSSFYSYQKFFFIPSRISSFSTFSTLATSNSLNHKNFFLKKSLNSYATNSFFTNYNNKMFEEYKEKDYTLIFVLDYFNQKVLLGKKKRGFGSDKWNGFGGKIEQGETPLDSIVRELQEESNLNLSHNKESISNVGYIKFFMNHMKLIMNVHIYTVTIHKFQDMSKVNDIEYIRTLNEEEIEKNLNIDELKESEEMLPRWFSFNEIPFDSMWIDDKFWLPEVIFNNKRVLGR